MASLTRFQKSYINLVINLHVMEINGVQEKEEKVGLVHPLYLFIAVQPGEGLKYICYQF